MHKRSPSSRPVPQARLKMVRRFSPGASLLPFFRFVVTLGLIVALLSSGLRFFTQPESAGALEFTTRLIHTQGGQIGILDEAVADMDGDGDMDIVTAGNAGVRVYQQTSAGKFSPVAVGDDSAYRVELGDFDKDGQKDILASLKNNPGVRWYHNEGGMSFSEETIGSSGSPGLADEGDLDQDGDVDVVTANKEGEGIVLRRWMNDGDGVFTSTTLTTDAKVTSLAVGGVNGDAYPDIVTGGTQGLQRWSTTNGSSWSRIDIDDGNVNKSFIAMDDVTGDGKIDIVTADSNTDLVALYINLDNSAWQRNALEGDADAGKVVLADFEGDKDMDIIVTSQDDNVIYWYNNNGQNDFTRRTIAEGLQSVLGVAVADIDKDGDLDFTAADHFRGSLYWYERVRAKPVATAPGNIQQSASGSGLITFDTTVSDEDLDPSRLRIEYSVDSGATYYKAAIHAVTVSDGVVDLDNNLPYQIGTRNSIDTHQHDTVKVTVTWNPKSTNNLGPTITGDVGTVKLRATARDSVSIGTPTSSATFRVDNRAPQGLANFRVTSMNTTEAQLAWTYPSDSSALRYLVHYGTDAKAVADLTSEDWTSDDDANLADIEATNTTIKGLTENKTYTFKLVVRDEFGNQVTSPTVAGVTQAPAVTPIPGASGEPTPTTTTDPISPSGVPSITPRPTPPSTTFENKVPVADAGTNQIVNPNTLVILDGTASQDPDTEALIFSWRQLSGPSVNLLSARTATPSFSAGEDNETYIFSLNVRDPKGASSTDVVTVATKSLPAGNVTPVKEVGEGAGEVPEEEAVASSPVEVALRALDLLLVILAIMATSISIVDRMARGFKEGAAKPSSSPAENTPKGQVVHYRTGEAVSGAQVLIYSSDGKLKASERTDNRGQFATLFPAGSYTIVVQAPGFTFAPMAVAAIRPEQGILYSGGTLNIQDGTRPVAITIPMKPTGHEVRNNKIRMLHFWQATQRWGRMLSWPIFLIGAGLNTLLIFWTPTLLYLVIEVLYVVLVIVKVALEVRVRPTYGVVRDAITHVLLDLAVVRLYQQGTNRLVMTRVTNAQGKFFALPPAGVYTITVTKPGYAVFTKERVTIAPDQDSALQITTDLMPVTPQAGLAALRSAVL